MKRWVSCAATSALLFSVLSAHAAPEQVARAEKLYDEALALIEKADYPSACPKLEESQTLDPALGTQFNLGDCFEHIGKVVEAYRLFSEVSAAARAAGNTKLATRASDRAAALETKIGRVTVRFSSVTPNAVVKIDGSDLPAAQYTKLPIAPGAHRIDVAAPGKKPWTRTIEAHASTVDEVVIALDDAVATVASEKPMPVVVYRRDPRFRVAGIAVGVAGIVGIGLGAAFGIATLSKRNEARAACGDDDPSRCRDRNAVQLWSDAETSGNVSTVAFVGGGALLAGGALLWLFAPKQPVTVTGSSDGHSASLHLRGSF